MPTDDSRTYEAFLVRVPVATATTATKNIERRRHVGMLLFSPISSLLGILVNW